VEFLKGDIMKPLAKSLHTVTVLVRVAKTIREYEGFQINNVLAVDMALDVLGLADLPDVHGLAAAAIKQLNKFA
jgi:hypothetical protein